MSKYNETPLATHDFENKRSVDFIEARIIEKEPKNIKRKLLEAVFISNCSQNMNYKSDTKDLNKLYAGIFNSYNNKKQKIMYK